MKKDEPKAKMPVNLAVIMIGEAGTEGDSGKAFSEVMLSHGHKIETQVRIKNDLPSIQKALREAMEDFDVHAIACIGGIGVSDRDVTIEALEDYVEKEMPGFGEMFRALQYEESGASAMMQRTMAFISEKKVVYALPDVPAVIKIASEKLIAHEIGHIVSEARSS